MIDYSDQETVFNNIRYYLKSPCTFSVGVRGVTLSLCCVCGEMMSPKLLKLTLAK